MTGQGEQHHEDIFRNAKSIAYRNVLSLHRSIAYRYPRKRRLFDEVLAPAMPVLSGFGELYGNYRRFSTAPPMLPGADNQSDLWMFYAVSRIFDTLIIGERNPADQPPPGEWPDGKRPSTWQDVTWDEMAGFFGTLGMTRMRVEPVFHPFFHEIAAARLDPALGVEVLVEDELWPGFWFGDLLIARAGVKVCCGPDAPVRPDLAVRSVLHFTWDRAHRRTRDLSHGWGPGSQWGTNFRRDYVDGEWLRYNVDGDVRLTCGAIEYPDDYNYSKTQEFSPAERIELLRHRCFVHTSKADDDFWCWDDTYAERAPATRG